MSFDGTLTPHVKDFLLIERSLSPLSTKLITSFFLDVGSIKLGFSLCATSGTAKYLISNGIKCKKINKVSQGSPHIVERLNKKNIALVINTTEGKSSISDSFGLRRSSLMNKIPYFTTLAAVNACIESIEALKKYPLKVRAHQDN